MGERERQKLLTLVGRGVQQQFQMSEFRVWKCDRTDSCQTKPHDKATWDCEYTRSNPWLPCRAVCYPIFFTKTFWEIWKETMCLDGWKGMERSFIPVPPNTGVTVLTLIQYVLTLHQPASLSLRPFPLTGPKVFGYLSHKTLLKPWQANLPMKGLKMGWKPLALKKWYCKRIFTPCLYK